MLIYMDAKMCSGRLKTYSHACSLLKKYYGEVLAEYSLDEVIRRVENLIIPEVVMIRGDISHEFLSFIKHQGFKLVNCVHLIEL